MYKKILAEDVLRIIKEIGPSQPSQIKKHIDGSDTMMIGALLSSLLAKGDIYVTKVKKGGSPFYHTKEQFPKLEYLGQYLNEKDERAFQLLKKQKVIRDREQTPLVRVCLRNIPDFAKKIDATVANEPEIFWRYFLLPQNEAPNIIKEILGIKEEKKIETPKEIPKETKKDNPKTKDTKSKQKTLTKEQKTLTEKKETESSQNHEEISKLKKELEELRKIISKKDIPQQKSGNEDIFLTEITEFCKTKNIDIIQNNIIKKSKDIEFKARATTNIGELYFHGIAKAKKRLTEAEIDTAYKKATEQNLPLICISKSEQSKKIQAIIKEKFTNTITLNLEQ